MLKRIVVTGATGFIGQHVIPLLQASGYEVIAVTRQAPTLKGFPDYYQIDLMDADAVFKFIKKVSASHLLHLAWNVEPGVFWHSNTNFLWLQASIHLVREFVTNGGQHVIIAGTCAEYDWQYDVCNEQTTPCKPGSLYSACKHALHGVLEQHAKKEQYRLAWGRVFFPFGSYESTEKLLPTVINGMLSQTQVQCSEGSQKRDFIHIDDVALAFSEIVRSDIHGAVNIGSGTALSIREIVTYIAQQFNSEQLIRFANSPQKIEPPLVRADMTRLINESHWKLAQTIYQRIDQTINWWEQQYENNN